MTKGGRCAERLAASLALLMLVVAAAELLTGAIRNWAAVLVALAGFAVATIAGWYVVSRHGIARWLGLIVVAGSAIPLAWSIHVADLRPARLVSAVACTAISVWCARMALRRTGQARLAAAPVTPHAAHPVLIINPRSGGGKATRLDLVAECKARGIEPVVFRPGCDLPGLAQAAIADGADIIGVAGGDGSQAVVAQIAAAHNIPHVVVPAGTRNHFALDLGIDPDDVIGALDAFADGRERRIDLAEVNGRIFVNNASLGIYAKIIQSAEYRDTKLKTAAEQLPAFLGPDARPPDLRFTGPDGAAYSTAHLILVSNNPYQLDHIGGRGTRERMDDGVLGVVSARIDGPIQAQSFTALEAIGQVRRFTGWLEWTTRRFEVRSGGSVELGIDGEAMVLDPPLVFVSRQGALRVRIPRSAGRSTAVRVNSRSTVAELVALATGRKRKEAAVDRYHAQPLGR